MKIIIILGNKVIVNVRRNKIIYKILKLVKRRNGIGKVLFSLKWNIVNRKFKIRL